MQKINPMLIWIQSQMSSIEQTLEEVSRALGIGISFRHLSADSGYTFAIRISDLPKATSFELRVRQGLLSWYLDLFLNNFPREMLLTFTNAYQAKRDEILGQIDSAQQRVETIQLTVNDVDIFNLGDELWEQLALSLKMKVQESNQRLDKLKTSLIIALSLLVPLFSEDLQTDEELLDASEVEGSKSKIERNHYERSRVNRALCLDYYGFECQACLRTMKSLYGPIGEGVIHVHHIEPVSQMSSPRRLDPIRDLVPLCPNCHTIVHQESPPLSIEKLKMLVKEF